MATQTYTNAVTLTDAGEFNRFDIAAYPILTSVSGTNTVTATGPANYSLNSNMPPVVLIPANTNSGATTLAITPSGGAALAAKNVYLRNAACTGGELVQSVPALLIYDGTQYQIVATGSTVTTTTTQTLTNKTLTSPTLTTPTINTAASVGGSWSAAATWTLPAWTAGGQVSGAAQTFTNLGQTFVGGSGIVTNSSSDTALTVKYGTSGGSIAGFQHTHASNPSYIYVLHDATNNDAGHSFLRMDEAGGSATNRFLFYSNGGLANYSANNVNISDVRLKKDVTAIASEWDNFKRIGIVKFKYKDQTHDDFNFGVIAQQIETVYPELVEPSDAHEDFADDPIKLVYENDLKWIGMRVLQEALQRIEQLEAKVAELEKK
jgi:hypothetical protein